MFLGRSQRPVNLGGRKQATTSDALRNAEKQRAKRAAQRRELNAAMSVQKLWRSRLTLREGRLALASAILDDQALELTSELFAYVLPILGVLPITDQRDLMNRLSISDNENVYSKLLVDRLPFIWNQRPLNQDLLRLGFGVMRHQDPPQVSEENLLSLLNLPVSEGSVEILDWAASRSPSRFLGILLSAPTSVIDSVPSSVLRRIVALNKLPVEPNQGALRILISKLADINLGGGLILPALLSAVDPSATYIRNLAPLLTSKELIEEVVKLNPPEAVANYVGRLLDLFPEARTDVLLHVLLAVSSPLRVFWTAFKQHQDEHLLYIIVELVSYWLLVAKQLISNTSTALEFEDMKELATIVRDQAFHILWETAPNTRYVLSNYETSVLKLLRQLYVRDSRRELFGKNFWQMEDRILGRDQVFFEAVNNGLLDNMMDDEEDELEEEITNSNIVLKASAPLRILEHAPFFVGFETRATLFYKCIDRVRGNYRFRDHAVFAIRREHLLEDAKAVFAILGHRVANQLKIEFVSNGMTEVGIDGGGLTKEFLVAVCNEAFKESPKNEPHSILIETANHMISPNPIFGENTQLFTTDIASEYYFLGQLVGKCLYEHLLVDVEFAPFFLAKWNVDAVGNAIRSSFEDLYTMDAELYNSLAKLHHIHDDDVAALGLDFTVVGSQGQEIELRPHGSKIAVTDTNKLEYIRELGNYKLNTSLRPQTASFLIGLRQIIELPWLSMFSPVEVNELISGDTRDIDIEDLRRHTIVSGFPEDSQSVANLWKVLRELTPEQRTKFLKFVTSTPKGPLLGFGKLDPLFGIRCSGFDETRLPTASTCVNLLKLPAYSSIEMLREKLLCSIESDSGFDLS